MRASKKKKKKKKRKQHLNFNANNLPRQKTKKDKSYRNAASVGEGSQRTPQRSGATAFSRVVILLGLLVLC